MARSLGCVLLTHYLFPGNDSNLLIVFYVQIMPD
ncbi:PTS mannitol transporter subunit IIA, partial [Shigella boydii]